MSDDGGNNYDDPNGIIIRFPPERNSFVPVGDSRSGGDFEPPEIADFEDTVPRPASDSPSPDSSDELSTDLPLVSPPPSFDGSALRSEGESEYDEEEEFEEDGEGEIRARRTLAERFGEWLEQRIEMSQARHDAEAPLREAAISRKVELLKARTKNEVALAEQNGKLRQAGLKGRGGKSDGFSGRNNKSPSSGLGSSKGGKKPSSGNGAGPKNSPSNNKNGAKGIGGGKSGAKNQSNGDGKGRFSWSRDKKGPGGASGGSKGASGSSGSKGGSKGRDKGSDGSSSGGKGAKGKSKNDEKNSPKGAKGKSTKDENSTDSKPDSDQAKKNSAGAKDKNTGKDSKDKPGTSKTDDTPDGPSPGSKTPGDADSHDRTKDSSAKDAPDAAADTSAAGATKDGKSSGAAKEKNGKGRKRAKPEAGSYGDSSFFRGDWYEAPKRDQGPASEPGAEHWVDFPDHPTPRGSADEEPEEAVIVEPRALPRAPEPHTERPGTTRPTTAEGSVTSNTQPVQSTQSGLAAEHQAATTVFEFPEQMRTCAETATRHAKTTRSLSTGMREIADATTELSSTLKRRDNIKRDIVDGVSSMAADANLVAKLVGSWADLCKGSAEVAVEAQNWVDKNYIDGDVAAMDAGGLTEASAASHH